MTSQILIIDKLGLRNQPDYLAKYNFVSFVEKCNCEKTVDPQKYAAVFVHQRNDDEVIWAKQKIGCVVIFSGSYPSLVNIRGENRYYNVPKHLYDVNLYKVLDNYCQTGTIDPLLFDS